MSFVYIDLTCVFYPRVTSRWIILLTDGLAPYPGLSPSRLLLPNISISLGFEPIFRHHFSSARYLSCSLSICAFSTMKFVSSPAYNQITTPKTFGLCSTHVVTVSMLFDPTNPPVWQWGLGVWSLSFGLYHLLHPCGYSVFSAAVPPFHPCGYGCGIEMECDDR